MPPHVLGVMQRGSSLHERVASLKNQVSSVGQGPPPVPPLTREERREGGMDGGKKKEVRGWEREEARDREGEEKAQKFSTSSISAALTHRI